MNNSHCQKITICQISGLFMKHRHISYFLVCFVSVHSSPVQYNYLVLNTVLFALQCLLGDALDSNEALSALLFSQHHLRECPPVKEAKMRGKETAHVRPVLLL